MEDKLTELCSKHNVSFGNGKFEMHMNLGNSGVRVDSFLITWPNNPLDNKRVARQVDTPKKKTGGWGKGVVSFYLVSEDKTPSFPNMEKFIEHYAKDTINPSEPPK